MIRLLPFKPVRLLVTLLFVLSLGSVTAQTAEIRGKITDQAGNPVVGASVIVKGTTTGTTSLSDGSFALDAAPGATLQIMMLGYKSAEQAVTKAASFYEITLTEDSQLMEDVVVVGYGAVKKSDLTGSVASVKMNDLTSIPSTSVDGLLQGRAAGLQVMNTSQDPGSGRRHPHPRQQLARRLEHPAHRSQRIPAGRCRKPLANQRLGHRVD